MPVNLAICKPGGGLGVSELGNGTTRAITVQESAIPIPGQFSGGVVSSVLTCDTIAVSHTCVTFVPRRHQHSWKRTLVNEHL